MPKKKIILRDERRYQGELAKPIKVAGVLGPEDTIVMAPHAEKQLKIHRDAKMHEVWQFFDIPPKARDRYKQLANKLLLRCTPGFQPHVVRPVGRRMIFDDTFGGRVKELVDAGADLDDALLAVAKERGSKSPIAQLRTRYKQSIVNWVLLTSRAEEFAAEDND